MQKDIIQPNYKKKKKSFWNQNIQINQKQYKFLKMFNLLL